MFIWQLSVVVINLAIAVGALVGMRYGMAAIVGVHAKDELDKKDNFSFGIAFAGGLFGFAIMMSAAISGQAEASLANEVINVLSYAALGIALLAAGYFIQDRVLLRNISLNEGIKSGNLAAGIVVGANLIAIGTIARSSMYWVEGDALAGILPVIAVFMVSQLILACVTCLRLKVFGFRNKGASWELVVGKGNAAVAVRFAGQMVATALVLTSVGSLVEYQPALLLESVLTWLGLGLVFMLVLWLVYRALLPLVLAKVDISEEVDRQQNIGVAAIEAALLLGVASLFVGFLA